MRLSVRPGLECPPRELSNHAWTWQEQFENDVWYVEHLSFSTDCKMFLNLVKFAFDRKNSSVRASANRGPFTGYDEKGNAISLNQLDQNCIDAYLRERGSIDSGSSSAIEGKDA